MKRVVRSVLIVSCILIPCNAANDVEALKADMQFFTDPSCGQLKTNMRAKDLDGFKSDLLKTVATALLDKTYDTTYRAATYQAYPSPRELGNTLKLGDGFSRYENITGICLEAGEHVVFVGDTAFAHVRSTPGQNRSRFASREVRWLWPACCEKPFRECRSDRAWSAWPVERFRCREDFDGRLSGRRPCTDTDRNTKSFGCGDSESCAQGVRDYSFSSGYSAHNGEPVPID